MGTFMIAIQILAVFFLIVLIVMILMPLIAATHTKLSSIIVMASLLFITSAVYAGLCYLEAQGKSDFMANSCGVDITALTILAYPEAMETELDYCLDLTMNATKSVK
jgi:predicted ABC-type exoprotein transport system permease subunit